jgi:hypothetical protein
VIVVQLPVIVASVRVIVVLVRGIVVLVREIVVPRVTAALDALVAFVAASAPIAVLARAIAKVTPSAVVSATAAPR